MRPLVSDTAEELYQATAPLARGDEERGWPLLHLVEGSTRSLDEVEQLSRDNGETPGWAQIMDVDQAPLAYLPWLGLFVGVWLDRALPEDEQRSRIRVAEGLERGTVAAFKDAVARTLTGNKTIYLIERDGSAYRFTLNTLVSETPDPAATEAAARRQKPAGLVMTYAVVTSRPINTLEGSIDAQPGTIDSLT